MAINNSSIFLRGLRFDWSVKYIITLASQQHTIRTLPEKVVVARDKYLRVN